MKKVLFIFIFILLVSSSACNKTDTAEKQNGTETENSNNATLPEGQLFSCPDGFTYTKKQTEDLFWLHYCIDENKHKDGEFRVYDEDSHLKAYGKYKDDKPIGAWMAWDKNQKLEGYARFNDQGALHGWVMSRSEDNIASFVNFVNGEMSSEIYFFNFDDCKLLAKRIIATEQVINVDQMDSVEIEEMENLFVEQMETVFAEAPNL